MSMENNYTVYHIHSDYSLLDSATHFEEYVDLAKKNGQTAIASTEHGKPLGWVSKKMYCDKAGIKFIHGVEIYLTEKLYHYPNIDNEWYEANRDISDAELQIKLEQTLKEKKYKVRDNYHTVLLAKNWEGIKELNTLVSKSCDQDHFYYTNRITFEEFLNVSDNIISTSACLASPLNKLSPNHPMYLDLAKKYTFFEIQPHNVEEQIIFNQRLAALAEELGKPLIAGTDTHNANQYKAECRNILNDSKKKPYADEDAFDLTYKTYDELVSMFEMQGALPEDVYLEAIENTNVLNDMVSDFELDTAIKYPILYGSREADSAEFEKTIERKFKEKLEKGIIPEYQKEAFKNSIQEELRVFQKLNMDGFMLSMSELISWCKEQGMAIGTARGSVGGSRIAYVTDIIDLNPETWNTVFSRFCNEDRVEIGDIDIDCVESDRPAIFNHIIGRFGEDKVAKVAAYGTLQEKAAIDEIGRALAVRYDRDNPHSDDNPYSLKCIDAIKKEFEKNPEKTKQQYPEIFYYMDGLVGVRVSQSVHPAGVVISPISLVENYGVFDKDGETCLMMDMEEAHEVGVAKYDFLVLKTVQVIRDTCSYIGQTYPKTHEINWLDEKVWNDMIKSPHFVFQFESDFGFDCLKKFVPQNIFDMSLVTASIRPSGTSYRDALLARKKHYNPSEIIDELLKDNYGYLIYQEDTIKFLQQICGLSGSSADNIRRAIGRKQKERLDAALPSILEGYCSKSSQPREVAEKEAKEFLQIIEDSANYQFGYNHSIAYCLLGYYCAYYRYYYPIEFITACLNNAANNDDIENGALLAKERGIQLVQPTFRYSKSYYFFDKASNSIYKGVAAIKGLNECVADELYEMRNMKFNSFMCFLVATKIHTTIKMNQLEALIQIEYFKEFGEIPYLMACLAIYKKYHKRSEIKKEELPVIGLDETFMESVCTKVTAKKFTGVDMTAVMEQIVKATYTYREVSIGELVAYQQKHIGHIDIADAKYKRVAYVEKVDTTYSPKLFTYALSKGNRLQVKVSKVRYAKQKVQAGDILVIKKCVPKCKQIKNENGDWVANPYEKEWWLEDYVVVDNIARYIR